MKQIQIPTQDIIKHLGNDGLLALYRKVRSIANRTMLGFFGASKPDTKFGLYCQFEAELLTEIDKRKLDS